MKHNGPVPVVDLFAGPGGLGEGFSSLDDGNAFRILVSAEMESSAHQTLRLRAFYRILKRHGDSLLNDYYRFCNGETKIPYGPDSLPFWIEAGEEAQQLTLGNETDNEKLWNIITKAGLGPDRPWVLIGGPPCQAYSLVGRSRNRGKAGYRAEEDHRHFLYREYLKVIQRFKPAVFVMENVKGILSSKIEGQMIFHSILQDLSSPDEALDQGTGSGYKIHSLVVPVAFERGVAPEEMSGRDFVIRSEDYGIPQARHRVILLGIREDIAAEPRRLARCEGVTVSDAISGLPALRSRLSKEPDNQKLWFKHVKSLAAELSKEAAGVAKLHALSEYLVSLKQELNPSLTHGSIRVEGYNANASGSQTLNEWYRDNRLSFWLNHEARSHMRSDLRRYLYAASYAEVMGTSPKGHEEFQLKGLRPEHQNWESGNFADRFRVQLWSRPSTTVTSHISKDGHYFIHPDPTQCRSLTVREAARLQTFPDNYFFQGTRTQQFHQVGNAVPPMLAYKIAEVVEELLMYS
jgi:DNA (cytosine-5)-methyltransferase 1